MIKITLERVLQGVWSCAVRICFTLLFVYFMIFLSIYELLGARKQISKNRLCKFCPNRKKRTKFVKKENIKCRPVVSKDVCVLDNGATDQLRKDNEYQLDADTIKTSTGWAFFSADIGESIYYRCSCNKVQKLQDSTIGNRILLDGRQVILNSSDVPNFNDGRQKVYLWRFVDLQDSSEKLNIQPLDDLYLTQFYFDATDNPNSNDGFVRKQLLIENSFNISENQNLEAQDVKLPISARNSLAEICKKGVQYAVATQCADGHWAGDYGGPHFLTPGLVIAAYAINLSLGTPVESGFRAYIKNHQQIDGGWGLHIEGASELYPTCLNYVALRILGLDKSHPVLVKARAYIHKAGGCLHICQWGKVYLAIIGLYEWEGVPPILPELWSLPSSSFFLHPSCIWCHCRMVYLPMSYLYGKKIVKPLTPLIKEIRKEIYLVPYENVDWNLGRNSSTIESDLFQPISSVMRNCQKLLNLYEIYFSSTWPFKKFRQRSLRFVLELIRHEDEFSNFLNLGPVNKVLNMICVYNEDPHGLPIKQHIHVLSKYLWLSEDGLKMQGEPSSETWDTALMAQAIWSTNLHEIDESVLRCLQKVNNYLKDAQMLKENNKNGKFFRISPVGGWGFTVGSQNWPVSDTSSEALKAILRLNKLNGAIDSIAFDRLTLAVDFILKIQNPCGGWGTYENYRAGKWVEIFCPAEIFGNIMIDHTSTECTSSCVMALIEFMEQFNFYRTEDINKAIFKGKKFIISKQQRNGGWHGSWGISFTYGAYFAISALAAGEVDLKSKSAIKSGCEFLLSKQQEDGGWSESILSSSNYKYMQAPSCESNVCLLCLTFSLHIKICSDVFSMNTCYIMKILIFER